jgi:hypothetical protein
VDLDFLQSAEIRLRATVNVARPPDEVFAAFAHDPANWGEFFPGFDKSGRWLTPAPHGVGSRYTKRFLGITVEEAILIWDEGARLGFHVVGTTAPVFHAWAEDYRFEPDGKNSTSLKIDIGGTPRLAFRLAKPLVHRAFPSLMTRVGHNLDHGRWFSSP